jgi:thymidylate synthase (FAD)
MTCTKLVWITPEAEQTIAYCARVSNPANQHNHATAAKLLGYCAKHGHWSVFEMASACVEINTTRDISTQILRHRSFSFQEFSQRYAAVELRPELPEMRRQDLTNRQNSIDDLSLEVLAECDKVVGQAFVTSYRAYTRLLELGVAKECARKVLPINSPTRLYMSGTIRSWIHYLQVRCGEETQLEHREIAQQIKDILLGELPTLEELL